MGSSKAWRRALQDAQRAHEGGTAAMSAGARLVAPREDGTCCWGVPNCGGVYDGNSGGWGHVPRDLRFSKTILTYNSTNNPVASNYIAVPGGNTIGEYDGIHLPICIQHDAVPPTRLPPVKPPPPPPNPPPPVVPTMQCWDGTICPGRKEIPGIQCCSVPVMAGRTCAQIFICDKKRTCTGKRACYQ